MRVPGKRMPGCLYVHRSATDVLPGSVQQLVATAVAPFAWAIAKWSAPDRVSLIECLDWDEAPEPTVGRSFLVGAGRIVHPPADPWIYHHKWMFVHADYAGFDVEASEARSRVWERLEGIDRRRIGKKSYWETVALPRL